MAKARAMDEAIVRDDYENEVRLVGRSSGPALEKELPSGDKVVETMIAMDMTPLMWRYGAQHFAKGLSR
ncbi:MAG: hypothetical protein RLZZ35_755 [Actinomycetota bacterium]